MLHSSQGLPANQEYLWLDTNSCSRPSLKESAPANVRSRTALLLIGISAMEAPSDEKLPLATSSFAAPIGDTICLHIKKVNR